TGIPRAGDAGRRNATGTLLLEDDGPKHGPAGQPLPMPMPLRRPDREVPLVRGLPPEPPYTPPSPRGRDPEQRRHRRRFLLATLIVALLGAGVATAGWWYGSGRYTSVPKLSMLTVSEARTTARSAHIKVDVLASRQHSEDVPVGSVISTDPSDGSKVLRGSSVEVRLSSGPERFTVPSGLVGASRTTVGKRLAPLPLDIPYTK